MLKFLGKKIKGLFKEKVSEEAIEELEALFFEADLGANLSIELTDKVRSLYKKDPSLNSEKILKTIKEDLLAQLNSITASSPSSVKPHIILVVGVNGNGKTTSVAKLAHRYQQQGKKVLIAAADTFRAAAVDQLERWAERSNSMLVKGNRGSDAAAVVFDAIEAAKMRGVDVVLIDTAGRLHTRTDLMQELEKIHRVCNKAMAGAPHEILLVLDATTGQNAIEQTTLFHKYTPLSGLILTKLDGSAKGGTVLALQKKVSLPIKYVGLGETLEALQPFDPSKFLDSLFSSSV